MTGFSESRLLGFPETMVSPNVAREFQQLLTRRLGGEPVAYLTGEREFYGRKFAVDPRVLIPRPETEHLIELALSLDLPTKPRILDLGTGSGCLAITLAAELPQSQVWGLDHSLAAIRVAGTNRRRHRVPRRVQLSVSDWATSLAPSFSRTLDLLVSNPPYIDRNQPSDYDPEVALSEPEGALFAPLGGLAAYDKLFRWQTTFAPQAPLITEIGRGHLKPLTERAAVTGLSPQTVVNDYAGIERTVLWHR